MEAKPGRPEARTWKLMLAYDGGPFAGWQVQPGLPTVQGRLAEAIEHVTGEQVLPQGSGRTDTGVHALGQVASFRLRAAIPAANLHRALNHRLPASIRVLSAELTVDSFHARHSARSKLYEYRIWRGELCPPWTAPYVYACPWPLKIEAMREAAQAVLGEHDFTSFAAREPDLSTRRNARARMDGAGGEMESEEGSCVPDRSADPDANRDEYQGASCVRRLLTSSWEQQAPDLLCYQVRGTGFLHHMVRNLVGTFLAVGRGQIDAAAIPSILAARNRSAAGPTAPARGLFLHSVEY
jgi:tRNA pseudouridine38-40 synthase